jgi:protein-tyrosine phosphatase
MDQIRPRVFIGAYRDTLSKSYLDFKSIQAMLQLTEKVEQPNIISLYLPVEDLAPIFKEQIRQGVDFLLQHKHNGVNILVACGAGINRSRAFSAAALKEEEGLTLFDVFKEVRPRHPESMPHEPVWQSLCEYYAETISYSDLMRMGKTKG